MKKSLSLLIAITMVFSMFASVAFAQEEQGQELDTMAKFEVLKAAGIMQGHADGSAGLEENMTRAQAAVVITALFGLDTSNPPAVPTFSDVDTDHWAYAAIEAAVAAGIINGRGNGEFDPGTVEEVEQGVGYVTVQELAVMLVLGLSKTIGLEIDPSATVEGNVAPWAAPYVAAAIANGLLAPAADYTQPASRAQLVEAAYATKEVNVYVVSVEVVSSKSINVVFNDSDEVYTYEFEEAFKPNAENTVEVEHNGKVFEITFVYEVTEPMAIDAKALNLIQVEVTFNNEEYDAEEVKDEDNYVLEDDEDEIEAVDVEVNGTKVIVTFEEAVKNKSTWTLTVDKKVTGKEAQFEVDFLDNTLPEVVGAEVVGKNIVKVTFSEPIDFGRLDDEGNVLDADIEDAFEVEGESVQSVKVLKNGTEVNVQLYGSIADEKSIELTVGGELADYAGHHLVPVTLELEVDPATDAPQVVGYKNAKTSEVTLIFNRDIKIEEENSDDDVYFYHTNTKNPALNVEVKNGNELKLTFVDDDADDDDNNPLPEGNAYIYIEEDAISDLWGNVNDSRISVKIEVVQDTTKPEVKEVEVKDSKTLKVTFSEEVKATKDNFTLLDAKGKKLNEIKEIDLAKNKFADEITITLRSSDLSGEHGLVIEGVEDRSGNKIDKVTIDVNLDGKEPKHADFVVSLVEKNADRAVIIVEFNQAMATSGQYSIVNKDNYVLNVGDESYKLSKQSKVTIKAKDNNKVAEIRIPDNSDIDLDLLTKNVAGDPETLDNATLEIGRVANAAGLVTTTLSSGPKAINDKTAAEVRIETIKATARDTLEIKFNQVLHNIDLSDFIIDYDGNVLDGKTLKQIASEFSTKVEKDGDDYKTILSVKLKSGNNNRFPFTYEDEAAKITTAPTTKSETLFGTPLADGFGPIVIADKIKPELDTKVDEDEDDVFVGWKDGVARIAYNQIMIALTEDVDFEDDALAATDLVIEDEFGKTLKANSDYTIDIVAGKYILVTLDDAYMADVEEDEDVDFADVELTISTRSTVNYIVDANDNTLKAFSNVNVDEYDARIDYYTP